MSPQWVMLVICLGVFAAALDQTVVVTALPTIMADLKLEVPKDATKAAWIVTSYIVGYTVAMPLFGRIADVYGYARIYQVSLVIFIIGTCGVALADNLTWVIGARVVQASRWRGYGAHQHGHCQHGAAGIAAGDGHRSGGGLG